MLESVLGSVPFTKVAVITRDSLSHIGANVRVSEDWRAPPVADRVIVIDTEKRETPTAVSNSETSRGFTSEPGLARFAI